MIGNEKDFSHAPMPGSEPAFGYFQETRHSMSNAKSIQTDLTTGSVSKQLIRYSVPLICTSLLQAVYSITDIMIVGHFVGSSGISAVNNASLIMNLLTQIIIGITVGGNVLIGQYFGAGDAENRKRATGSLFTLCMVSGVVCSAVFYLASRSLLLLLGAPALEEATSYLEISAWGLLPIFGYNALSAILRAMGNSRASLYFIILSTAINVALDILLVAVIPMGVAGAAVATVTAQCVSFLMALFYVVKHRDAIGFHARYLRPVAEKCKRILVLGFPLALQWTVASVSWLAVAFLINRYGVDCSAGNGVSAKIKDFCQLFIFAVYSGACTMVAQNLGAGEFDRAEKVMRTCMKLTLGMAACLILVSELCAPWMVKLFTGDAEVQRWAVFNLRIEIVAQLFYAAFFSYNTLATGAGNTLFVLFNSFVNCILVRLVLAILFERVWGIAGVFAACAIAPASSVPIGYWFYRSNRWRHSLSGAKPAEA